ncbi:MAG: hypothetical protein V1777_05065 [Candidatus Micrarchaeota archaeon]
MTSMALDIRTRFTPFALNRSRNEPVDLFVEITNPAPEAQAVSIELFVGYTLALDLEGTKSSASIRIPEFKPREKKQWYFRIFSKKVTGLGENPIRLQIFEHYNGDFSLIQQKHDFNLSLTVRP